MKFLLKENQMNRSQGNGNKTLSVAGKNNLMAAPHKYHLHSSAVDKHAAISSNTLSSNKELTNLAYFYSLEG